MVSWMSPITRSLTQTMRPSGERRALLARRLLVLLGLATLLVAALSGVVRLGVLPALTGPLGHAVAHHGPWMVVAFLGTVIGVERCADQARVWPYLGPLLIGVGGLVGRPSVVLAGGGVLALALLSRSRHARVTTLLAIEVVSQLVFLGAATLAVRGAPVFELVSWWMVFLVTTILGELAIEGERTPLALAVVAGAVLVASVASPATLRLLGGWFVLLGAWMFRLPAARPIARGGSEGHVARSIAAAAGWSLVAGLLLAKHGALAGGPVYDATLHAIFVGFVLGMLFGHGPLVLPPLIGRRVSHDGRFVVPFAVLQGSLVARVAGDLLDVPAARSAGGALNGVAVLLFVLSVASASRSPG